MQKSLEHLVAGWALAGGLLLIVIMLVTSVNVGAFALDRVSRLFSMNVSGLSGYEDVVSLLTSCAALMFFPYCQLKKGHVVVDLVSMPRYAWLLDRLWNAILVVLALFLAWSMVMGMRETREDNALSAVLGWSQWPFYLPGIVSMLLWALVAALQVYGSNNMQKQHV